MPFELWILKSHSVIPSECSLHKLFKLNLVSCVSMVLPSYTNHLQAAGLSSTETSSVQLNKAAHFEVPVRELGSLKRSNAISK